MTTTSKLAGFAQQLDVARNEIADMTERLEQQQAAHQRTSG